MKKVIMLFVAFIHFSGYALATTGKDNWNTIRQVSELDILQPQFAWKFGTKGLFNVCLTHEHFRSIDPVRVCSFYEGSTCVQSSLQQITMERFFHRQVCAEECLNDTSLISSYPTSFFLPVVEIDVEGKQVHLFSKKYSLPSCE